MVSTRRAFCEVHRPEKAWCSEKMVEGATVMMTRPVLGFSLGPSVSSVPFLSLCEFFLLPSVRRIWHNRYHEFWAFIFDQ